METGMENQGRAFDAFFNRGIEQSGGRILSGKRGMRQKGWHFMEGPFKGLTMDKARQKAKQLWGGVSENVKVKYEGIARGHDVLTKNERAANAAMEHTPKMGYTPESIENGIATKDVLLHPAEHRRRRQQLMEDVAFKRGFMEHMGNARAQARMVNPNATAGAGRGTPLGKSQAADSPSDAASTTTGSGPSATAPTTYGPTAAQHTPTGYTPAMTAEENARAHGVQGSTQQTPSDKLDKEKEQARRAALRQAASGYKAPITTGAPKSPAATSAQPKKQWAPLAGGELDKARAMTRQRYAEAAQKRKAAMPGSLENDDPRTRDYRKQGPGTSAQSAFAQYNALGKSKGRGLFA